MITGKITMANKEVIPFELYEEDAPITVANFVKLIKEGYYNGKTFHRVIPGFVSQGGCPFGNGTGDLGYTIPCETANNPHTVFGRVTSNMEAVRAMKNGDVIESIVLES